MWILIFVVMAAKGPAPSPSNLTVYQSAEACEAARTRLVQANRPFGKRVMLWSVCIPGTDAQPEHRQ